MNIRPNNSESLFLGNMPPISQKLRASTPDKRQVSIRWLAGSVLAGLTSLVLMGGALFAALDGRQQLAIQAKSFLSSGFFTTGAEKLGGAIKGGRITINTITPSSTSNVLMVSTIKRENDRDVVKVRPFMLINAPLSIATKSKLSYPKFNPLTVFSESGKPEPISKSSDSIYGADVESEVSIKVSAYPYSSPKILVSARRLINEIEELVRLAGPGLEENSTSLASLSNVDPTRFTISGKDPVLTPGIVITAENVSVIGQINPVEYAGTRYEDSIIAVPRNESLKNILTSAGMDEAEAGLIHKVLAGDIGNKNLQRGDKIRLAYQIDLAENQIGTTPIKTVSRISIYRGPSHLVTVARSDDNKFVYSREPTRLPQLTLGVKKHNTVAKSRLPSAYDGINRAALSEGLTPDLTRLLIRIFAFDVDFRNKITASDELTAFVSLEDGKIKPGAESEILFTSIKLNNITRKYYRFRDPETGRVDYYDETGKSAKKFLLRKPVPNAKFSSPYGFRRHPISRVAKMHWGVDWKAPRGTPIIAAGNGIIEKSGWAGGYGKQTILKHANGYRTYYNHQTAYAKGISVGGRVRQGQIIGYVGTTGYSTGPHLHYEVSVNGNKVNPMRIRLPKGKALKGVELLAFEAERDRIDALLRKNEEKNTRLALN